MSTASLVGSPTRLSRATSVLTSMVSLPYTFVNTAYKIYSQLNPVILTGAVDIVVVQQPDGTLKCSPFHVRFGKLAVIHFTARAAHGPLLVDVQINGEPVDCETTNMMLGENGEAYFHAGGQKCTCREPSTPTAASRSIITPQQPSLPKLLYSQESAAQHEPRAQSVASRDSGHMSEDDVDDADDDESDGTLQFYMDSDKSLFRAAADSDRNDLKSSRMRTDLRKRRLSRSTADLSVFSDSSVVEPLTSSSLFSSNALAMSSTSLSPTRIPPSIATLKSFASTDESISGIITTGMSSTTTPAESAAIGSRCRCKTKVLDSDRLSCLHLRPGRNDAEFSVVTRYQGTATARCHIYFWRYDERIVVSDVDGTITQSDVLGYVMPIVGVQWAQAGITHLYDRIKQNGYQMVYLTARAVGQSHQTRSYLSRVRQERNTLLPDGPLLLWPDSVWSAFRSEVVERRPDRFKTQCLKELRCLFPPDRNPFWAGYGNRVTDFVAYQAAGVPPQRIFMVNHLGELWQHTLRHNMATFHAHARDDLLVDALFPAISSAACEHHCASANGIRTSNTLVCLQGGKNGVGNGCKQQQHSSSSNSCRCALRNRHGSIDVTFANFNYWNFPPSTISEL